MQTTNVKFNLDNGLCTEAVTFFRVLGDAVIIENHISVKGVSDYDSCL